MNDYKYCKLVRITVEAYSACLSHALVTDSEEVMGLLLGNVITQDQKVIINIITTICLTRKCKEKDRVEFDEVQISKASEIADSLAKENKIDVYVVGWYHSHPKITLPPSSIDLNTQYAQQYQGPFVGLIISCFNNDNTNTNKINLIAFQTKIENGNNIPLYIDIDFINENDVLSNNNSNACNSAQTFASVLQNLLNEEEEQFVNESKDIESDDFLNNLVMSDNRQLFYTKILQNVSTPYVKSLDSEIDNIRNYIQHIKDANNKLKSMISTIQEMNKYKENDKF